MESRLKELVEKFEITPYYLTVQVVFTTDLQKTYNKFAKLGHVIEDDDIADRPGCVLPIDDDAGTITVLFPVPADIDDYAHEIEHINIDCLQSRGINLTDDNSTQEAYCYNSGFLHKKINEIINSPKYKKKFNVIKQKS